MVYGMVTEAGVLSVTVTFTVYGLPVLVVGVPLRTPAEERLRPGGKPLEVNV
jgi:hypothetical protein